MQQIEKGIAMPERVLHFPRKYPYADCEVGDSFLLEATKQQGATPPKHLKDKGWKFVSRKMPDGKFRVWRIA